MIRFIRWVLKTADIHKRIEEGEQREMGEAEKQQRAERKEARRSEDTQQEISQMEETAPGKRQRTDRSERDTDTECGREASQTATYYRSRAYDGTFIYQTQTQRL